MTIVGDYY